MKTMIRLLAAVLVCLTVHASASEPQEWISDKGRFTVAYTSALEPIVINQIHSWTLTLRDGTGQPVSDANISITGGMPAHNHGLATAPGVEALGDGNYRVQGLRFHMMGYWELTLTIETSEVSDTVIISLEL